MNGANDNPLVQLYETFLNDEDITTNSSNAYSVNNHHKRSKSTALMDND